MPALSRSAPDRSLAAKVAFGAGLLLASRWLVRRLRRYDLRGKTAIVTGGARGLGLELSRVLVEKGAQVAFVARDDAEIERALLDLRGRRAGARAIGVACDVTKREQLEAMLETVRRELGPIDVLINNAGKIEVGPLESMTVPDFEAAMALHCYAPLHAMLAVRAEMSARGGGRIANIASVGGLVSVPHLLPYCTSKFALIGLSEGMHAALAQDGIVVSTIAPGLMRTGSPRLASFKGEHEKEYTWFALSDSLPLISMSSARAARRIVLAIEQGESHVVLGLPAKFAAIAHGLFPGLISSALGTVNRLLPQGSDQRSKFGYESQSALAPSLLTLAVDTAALRNNEG